jgi:adenine deaminase
MIAYIRSDQDFLKDDKTQEMDADGMVLLPGLFEGHTHTISNRYRVEEFIKYVSLEI